MTNLQDRLRSDIYAHPKMPVDARALMLEAADALDAKGAEIERLRDMVAQMNENRDRVIPEEANRLKFQIAQMQSVIDAARADMRSRFRRATLREALDKYDQNLEEKTDD